MSEKKEYFVHDETDAPYENGYSPYRKGEEDDLYLHEIAQKYNIDFKPDSYFANLKKQDG